MMLTNSMKSKSRDWGFALTTLLFVKVKYFTWFCPALNQLAGTGWLTGGELKNFISRLPINTIGFKPNRPWNFSVTRQHPPAIDSQPWSFGSFWIQAKMNNKSGLYFKAFRYNNFY